MTIEELSKKAIHRPGMDLYSVEDAILLVNLCRQASLPVLGIDAFTLLEGGIRPDMGNSIDLSTKKYDKFKEEEKYDLAIQFLVDRRKLNFVYEIVY